MHRAKAVSKGEYFQNTLHMINDTELENDEIFSKSILKIHGTSRGASFHPVWDRQVE